MIDVTHDPTVITGPTKHSGTKSTVLCRCGWQSRPSPDPFAAADAYGEHVKNAAHLDGECRLCHRPHLEPPQTPQATP